MDFLGLVKRLASESGTELESKITSVAVPPAASYGTTTEHRTRLVNWIKQAWIEIQEDQDQWNFMVERGRMDLVQGQVRYDIENLFVPDVVGSLYDSLVPYVAPRDSRYIWLIDGSTTNPNPQICYYLPAEHFFGDRDRFNDRSFGPPSRYSIDRTGCIVFDVTPPNNNYYISFEFKRQAQELLIDTDVLKGLDGVRGNKYHMVVVYKAMVFYSMFDETDKQVARASKLYRDWLNKLRFDFLKEYTMAGTRG